MNKRAKILYIDDEELNLELFTYNLSKSYDIITGSDGPSGLVCLEQNPDINVVISDMKMPGMNGLEFISKAREKYSDKLYFILTGYDITKEISEAIRSKVIVKYFRKPFNMAEIEASIKDIH